MLCAKYVFHCVILQFISLFFCRNTKDTGAQRTSGAMKKEASGIFWIFILLLLYIFVSPFLKKPHGVVDITRFDSLAVAIRPQGGTDFSFLLTLFYIFL